MAGKAFTKLATAASEKPHLSPSQLETFAMCGERWRRRYIDGEIIPPGIAAIKGKTMHGAAEANFRQKLESREDLPVEHFREIAAEVFQDQISGDYLLTADEEGRGREIVLGEAKDAAVKMAEFHSIHQAPEYQPALVEQQFRIELPNNSHDLVGVIDLADERGIVSDFKTASKKKSQADADDSVQLTSYHVGYRALTGKEPEGLRLDVIAGKENGLKRQILETHRSPADVRALAFRLNVITNAINAGIFPPASPGSWSCSPKWCGYYGSCPYVNSERKAAAEANGE